MITVKIISMALYLENTIQKEAFPYLNKLLQNSNCYHNSSISSATRDRVCAVYVVNQKLVKDGYVTTTVLH